jgi:hypothetical protein
MWYRHVRDSLCVELCLTSEQIAGVLGGQTKRSNGHTDASQDLDSSDSHVEDLVSSEAIADDSESAVTKDEEETETVETVHGSSLDTQVETSDSITSNPETWPYVKTERGGDPKLPPNSKVRDIDDIDRKIVLTVRGACTDTTVWIELRKSIGICRRLTKQQIASIVAIPQRGGNAVFPELTIYAPGVVSPDANTWPSRDVVRGRPDSPPDKMEYRVDDLDRQIIKSVYTHSSNGGMNWSSAIREIGSNRRLTLNQIRYSLKLMQEAGEMA